MVNPKHRPDASELDCLCTSSSSSLTLFTQAVISQRPDSVSLFSGSRGSLSVQISGVRQACIGCRRIPVITSTCVTTGRLIWSGVMRLAELVINRHRAVSGAAWSSGWVWHREGGRDWRAHYETGRCVYYHGNSVYKRAFGGDRQTNDKDWRLETDSWLIILCNHIVKQNTIKHAHNRACTCAHIHTRMHAHTHPFSISRSCCS